MGKAGLTLLPIYPDDRRQLIEVSTKELGLSYAQVKAKPASFFKRYCRRVAPQTEELLKAWDEFVQEVEALNQTLISKGEPALLKTNASDTFGSIRVLIQGGYLSGKQQNGCPSCGKVV